MTVPGAVYEGGFKNGCYHGYGKYTLSSRGIVFSGHYQDNKRHGSGLAWNKHDGVTMEEEYSHGELISRRVRHNSNSEAASHTNTSQSAGTTRNGTSNGSNRHLYGSTASSRSRHAAPSHTQPRQQRSKENGRERNGCRRSSEHSNFAAGSERRCRRSSGASIMSDSERDLDSTNAQRVECTSNSGDGLRMHQIQWPDPRSNLIQRAAGGPRASTSELTKALKHLQRRWHPDRWTRVNLEQCDRERILERVKEVFQQVMQEKARLMLE